MMSGKAGAAVLMNMNPNPNPNPKLNPPHSFFTSFSPLNFLPFKPQFSLHLHPCLPSVSSSDSSYFSAINSTPLSSSHSIPTDNPGSSDPELRAVLQLATNSELLELEHVLFGPSYFSPLLKSITSGVKCDRFMVEEDFEEREEFINVIESRFLFLAADARSTLRGWRPSYRNVLLGVRKELSIPCSRKLLTEDLEVEIFIHLIHECSRDLKSGAALRIGAEELRSVLLKGGQLVALLKISEIVSSRLSRTILLEAAKRKIGSQVIKKIEA